MLDLCGGIREKYMQGNTNKVLFGKAKGYGYCQIYFDNLADAEACLRKALANGIKMPQNVSIVKVCQLSKVLPNGYFKIGTEYGAAYILASKLNECLTEEADQEQPTTLTNKEKRELQAQIRDGEIDVIIGTHAVFSKDIISQRSIFVNI